MLVTVCLFVAGCDQQVKPWTAGKLVVLVPQITQGPQAEFERKLVRLFAGQLHSELEMIPMPEDEILAALRMHRAHFAAVPLRSEKNPAALQFGPAYQDIRELVVCNDQSAAESLADFTGKESKQLAAVAGSTQEAALREAQANLPSLKWQTRHHLNTQDLLAEVGQGKLECAAANELQLADARLYYANLVGDIEIAPSSKLAWGFAEDADPDLLEKARIFFAGIRQDGTLHRLLDRYYGHINRLDEMDTTAFIAEINTVLPHFRHLFEEAATVTGLDWRLLAALAYQESQWNPLATSFTNVRGMMMLTEDTADRMNVSNRLDARESILAGANYLLLLKEQMPERIPEPDRTWLALAAYNQGFSHLEDARILTERAKMNPDSWSDVKKWMPLLSQPKFYQTLKHGYARGGEAVILVESIRNYYDMLKRLEPEDTSLSYKLAKPLRSLLHNPRMGLQR